mgnify:CR=1 FL=1
MSHVKEKTRLAIIGDGLAAAICLGELSKKEFNTDIQIDVFAPKGSVGRGLAYRFISVFSEGAYA